MRGPLLKVFQDIFERFESIFDVCERFLKQNFLVNLEYKMKDKIYADLTKLILKVTSTQLETNNHSKKRIVCIVNQDPTKLKALMLLSTVLFVNSIICFLIGIAFPVYPLFPKLKTTYSQSTQFNNTQFSQIHSSIPHITSLLKLEGRAGCNKGLSKR